MEQITRLGLEGALAYAIESLISEEKVDPKKSVGIALATEALAYLIDKYGVLDKTEESVGEYVSQVLDRLGFREKFDDYLANASDSLKRGKGLANTMYSINKGYRALEKIL